MKASDRIRNLAAQVDGHLRQFEVDLGNKVEPWVPPPIPAEDRKPKIVYPSLYIYDRKDKGLNDLPKSGKAIVNYRIRSRGVRSNDDGEDRYNADIEIRSIDPIKKGGATGTKDLAAIVGKYTNFDLRARNGAGQYAQGNLPPSPEDMAVAYAPRAKRKKAVAAIGGAAIAAGAALPGVRKAAGKIGVGALRAAIR